MRYLRLALLPFVFVACTEQEPAAPDIVIPPAFAATHTTVYENCMVEPIAVDGYIHFMTIETLTPSGNYIGRWKGQPQGLKGVGLTTGLTYQFNGVTQDTYVVQGDGFPLTETYVNRFVVVGPGADNNYYSFNTFKLTINGIGDVAVVFDNITVECR